MSRLKEDLKNLFVSIYKDKEVVEVGIEYEPEFQIKVLKGCPNELVPMGAPVEISSGYGKDLHLAGIEYEQVKCFGYEDQCSYCYRVYKFNRDGETVFVKFAGFYSSYDGVEFDEWFFVEPVQEIVTHYERYLM